VETANVGKVFIIREVVGQAGGSKDDGGLTRITGYVNEDCIVGRGAV
jgi:hypothetical protein